jgi:hypothetical protein
VRADHRVGAGPLTVNDHTEVLEVDAPRRLVLRVRAPPLGTAKVAIALEAHNAGTHVSMTEVAGDLLSKLAINRLTDPFVDHRNRLSLRRLRRISAARSRNSPPAWTTAARRADSAAHGTGSRSA